jgi:ATP-dependent Clp protease ATP-binding subunit ClpC
VVSAWRVPEFPSSNPVARFTFRARKVFQLANQEAHRLNHGRIGAEHLLLGMVKDDYGLASRVLRDRGCFLRTGRAEVEKSAPAPPEGVTPGALAWAADVHRVVRRAAEEASRLRHLRAGTGHVLLALLDGAPATAARVFSAAAPDLVDVRARVLAGLAETNWAVVEEYEGGERFGPCPEWGPPPSHEPGA